MRHIRTQNISIPIIVLKFNLLLPKMLERLSTEKNTLKYIVGRFGYVKLLDGLLSNYVATLLPV